MKTGRNLNYRWNVNAKHALFSKNGKWYHCLENFPGALFDAKGYILFNTKDDYLKCPSLQITSEIYVPNKISSIPEYVQIIFNDNEYIPPIILNDDNSVLDIRTHFEGSPKQIELTIYERNPIFRENCISHYGFNCIICNFNFEDFYGEIGKNFIHVHHIKQLSDYNMNIEIDPINDLRPVCPNCHSIIHKRRPPFSIEDVKLMRKNRIIIH